MANAQTPNAKHRVPGRLLGLEDQWSGLGIWSLASGRCASLLLFLAGLTLYVVTLAPTVLWGDDAELQRVGWTGGGISLGRGHQLWIAIARCFAHIPWGDPARRANLVSAVFAALALPFVYLAIVRLAHRRRAGFLGAGALAVSHTYWLHAVRAEVYSLHTFFLAAVVWLALRWADEPDRLGFLGGGAFLAGLSLANHLLMLTTLPALVWLLWHGATPPRWRAWVLAGAAFFLGAVPYLVTRSPATAGIGSQGLALAMGLFPLSPRDVALWVGFLGYQFPLSLALAPVGLAWLWRRSWRTAVFLVLAYLGSAGFAMSFQVPDQYAFYLPSYLVVALLIGAGLAAVLSWRPGLGRCRRLIMLCALVIMVPVVVYRVTPMVLNRLEINPLSVRALPYRDTNTFFLWPSKRGYLGARRFAEEVLSTLPPNAVLLADWSPLEALEYLQAVEGRRTDVTLIQIYAGHGQQVAFLLEQSETRPVFIAGTERYYDMTDLRRHFDVIPFGPIYRLERRS